MSLVLFLVLLPRHDLTPGRTRPLSLAEVCSTKWSLDERHVTTATRRVIFHTYGIAWESRHAYVVDHLISRELAGADDPANLWVQTREAAYRKDRVENALHKAVCTNRVSLRTAQRQIATNWMTAYQQWVR